jgi:glutathione S-transferase
MADYSLYYWPVPFRGHFIRAILAFAGKEWHERSDEVAGLMGQAPGQQPVPFMGPPVLIDESNGFAVSQMPAIAFYLGETLHLLPDSPQGRAMTLKIVNDANDVIDEITQQGGREMWTEETWREFLPRLKRWMSFWEVVGLRHDLEEDAGFLLGTAEAGIADIVTATLWSTLRERFPSIGKMLDEQAPRTAALCGRLWQRPALRIFAKDSDQRYGDAYCGGQIGQSLREVAGNLARNVTPAP